VIKKREAFKNWYLVSLEPQPLYVTEIVCTLVIMQILKYWLRQLFNLFVIVEPLIYFCVGHGTPLTKIGKNELLVMTRLFLYFFNVAAVHSKFGHLAKRTCISICVIPFSNFVNWITFGLLQIKCLVYIWTTLLITVHTFAVVIISLHMRKLAILLHLAWVNSKNLGFTLFLLYSHKGWTATLVCDSVYSLQDSGWVYSSVATLLLLKSTRFHYKKH